MTQTDAVGEWWRGLTEAERDVVLALRPDDPLPQGVAIDLAMSGVQVERIEDGARRHAVLPSAVVRHVARVRSDEFRGVRR